MNANQLSNNPLFSFMRQPKIYIKLPSRGNYWEPNSLDIPESGEIPVYSMTAKDELTFKTPDALMNGQAIADVIQSCIPCIKNAWAIPTTDIDYILIAIRLATYGDKMQISHTIPNIDEEVEHYLDLRVVLDQQSECTWIDQIIINENFIIFVKPLTFKNVTHIGLKQFETNKILNIVNNQELSEEDKTQLFKQSFEKLTQITIDLVSDSIDKIYANGQIVIDRKFIKEFVTNADKEIFDKIQTHLGELKKANELKPLFFETTEEQRQRGAPESYSVPINFNNSDFFGNGF